jgi:hypothetical protein
MEIEVDSNLIWEDGTFSGVHGIYKILFSSGHYYFGSSTRLNWRIREHVLTFKSNFTKKGVSAKCLKRMKDFDGRIAFILLENAYHHSKTREMRERERFYIDSHAGDPLMLNWIARIPDY